MQIAYGPPIGGQASPVPDIPAWASEGGEVVSVDVTPSTPDALTTVVEHHRDIRPVDLPSVELHPGEDGRAAGDVRPDGPPGEVEPGTPERSA
ncbi:hypothetical protein FH608_001470 [Nonomuraea phyllanthi]|uniref:Uncharacterized protein n=1 Tax=Nonomuraea phyllanthi TaxID=2219224 RepID=A0A5C4WUQ7_9ACTN|nr:hypothetical protein FH608_001470 [Nonomuraea phyllanthi]